MKTRKKQTTDQKTVEEKEQQTETPVDEEENVLSDKLNSLEMNKSKTEMMKKKKLEKTPKHEEESEKEEEQPHVLNQEDVDAEKEEEDDDDEEEAQRVEESDSSEDEVAPRNTIGDVPLVWYKDEEHIGYNIAGRKIKKQARKDKLDLLLAKTDDSKSWCKIYDEFNDEEVELTKEERKFIRRILKGKTPDETNPYQPYLDWFKWDDAKHPLSNAPEPKRRFIPSKWEKKKVDELVRAIRKGHIKMQKPKEESKLYLLWGDGSISIEMARHGLSYIPAPKPKLPGHEESYNPSVEYIPTQEEVNSYQLMYEEDRPKFIPKSFESLRSVPAYDNALKESFDRCLDLYLCPRTRKKRINIDPESLKPKLPNRKDLRPYPSTCYLEYRGHKSAIMSISVEVSGQWLASGSSDGTVRIWEVETGRCLRIWDVGEAVSYVAWNPVPELRILAVSLGHDVLLLNTGLGNEVEQEKIKELLHVEAPQAPADSGTPTANWLKYDKHEGIRLKHQKAVSSVEWHFKGDYFSTVMLSGDSRAILMHQLSKKHTQNILPKLHGLPVSSVFHPTRHIIFVATKKAIRVYDLVQRKLIRKLEPGVREVSSIAIHPAGDNLIVGSHEGKLCWFDMDLSTKPYRKLKCHSKDITDVAFHRSYPLFASCSDDSTAYVFHGMVYSDLNENPLIVPLEVLRGHKSTNGRGVMDCVFHPRQPWLFTAGADSVIKLYCN